MDETAEAARELFQIWVTRTEDKNLSITINNVAASQFIGQLFSETGTLPLDWETICYDAAARLEATPQGDEEQGLWADVNHLVPNNAIPSSIDELKASLPEEDRSGLNWSPEKTFFFIVIALKPNALAAGNPSMVIPVFRRCRGKIRKRRRIA